MLRQEQAELNQEMAVLLDILDRLEVALRNKRDDEASPTNHRLLPQHLQVGVISFRPFGGPVVSEECSLHQRQQLVVMI